MQIVMGVTYHSAKALGPGVVAHTADNGPTFVGPYLAGRRSTGRGRSGRR